MAGVVKVNKNKKAEKVEYLVVKSFSGRIAEGTVTEYRVTMTGNGGMWCSCPASKFGGGKPCKHLLGTVLGSC